MDEGEGRFAVHNDAPHGISAPAEAMTSALAAFGVALAGALLI
jgi:hypothetical protein